MKGIITEEEYQLYERNKLRDIALKLRSALSHFTINEISKGTGLKWDTVDRLRRGKGITFHTLCRIELFLKDKGFSL